MKEGGEMGNDGDTSLEGGRILLGLANDNVSPLLENGSRVTAVKVADIHDRWC